MVNQINDQLKIDCLWRWRSWATIDLIVLFCVTIWDQGKNVLANIRWGEDILIKEGKFLLPGCKAFLKNDINDEDVLIDAGASPIESAKKR